MEKGALAHSHIHRKEVSSWHTVLLPEECENQITLRDDPRMNERSLSLSHNQNKFFDKAREHNADRNEMVEIKECVKNSDGRKIALHLLSSLSFSLFYAISLPPSLSFH